jgi:heterodisulfide reductase subunit B
MKFALQRCCATSIYLKQYESSTDAVLHAIGVEVVDIKQFSCCGYPLKNFRYNAYLLSSAHNLALAEKEHLNIMTLCNCCYGSLKHANQILKERLPEREKVNASLHKEGLEYTGDVTVRHVLDILHAEIGIQGLNEKIKKRLNGLPIATHYGCHLLRPRQVAQFDPPADPSKFDDLVQVTGAKSIPWTKKLDCCGAPLWGVNDELSLDLTESKLSDAKQSGADFLCVACPFCQMQFDRVQRILDTRRGIRHPIPSILYTQLIGLALGIDAKTLGIDQNEIDSTGILKHFS